MLHAKNFNPLERVRVCITEDGVPKYEQKFVDGLPAFDEEGHMVMKPATFIPFSDMLEWFYTEYPTGVIIPERKTQEAVYSKEIDEIVYPKEIFECKIYIDRTRETPDAVGYGSCDTDTEYDPMGTARTKSIKDALRTLGFGIGLSDEDAVNALPESIPKEVPGRIVSLEERENFFVVSSENVVEAKKESIVDRDEITKTVEEATRKEPEKESEKEPEEMAKPEEEETPKEDVANEEPAKEDPVEEPKEAEDAPVTSDEVPTLFQTSDELMAIAATPFKVLKGAPKTMQEHNGKTFADVYHDAEGLFKVISRPGYKFEGKLPEEIVDLCRLVQAAIEEKENA